MIRLYAAVLCAFFLLSGSAQADDKVEIIYSGVGFQTLVPITRENIAQSTPSPTEIEATDPRLLALKALVDDAELGAFDDHAVRLRIRFFDGATLWMDNEGGIVWHQRRVALAPSALEEADKLLTATVGLGISGTEYDWIVEASRDHVRQNEGWHDGAYRVRLHAGPEPEQSIVVAKVLHVLDTTNGKPDYRLVEPRSFELFFDTATRTLIGEARYRR